MIGDSPMEKMIMQPIMIMITMVRMIVKEPF